MSGSRVRIHDFYPLFVDLRTVPSELPFELGGATQMGQFGDHHNNQDALALLSGRSHLVAVVSDGCASGGSRHSHNEVGAKLQVMMFAAMLDTALAEGGVKQLKHKLPFLEERLLEDLRRIIATLSAHPQAPNEVALSQSFFSATLLAAVVDAEDYVVFGCGDGVLWVNDRCIDLDEQEGRYLSERLVRSIDTPNGDAKPDDGCKTGLEQKDQCTVPTNDAVLARATNTGQSEAIPVASMMRVLHEGATPELHRLFLATDGFLDIFERFPTMMDRLTPIPAHPQEGHPGYNEQMVSEFRRKFWYEEDVEAWALVHGAHDDRTFALIRRAAKAGQGNQPCST